MSDPREAIHRHDLPRTPQKTFYVEIGFVVAYLVVQTLVGWDTFFIFLLQGGLVIALGRWGKRVVWSSARAYVWALAGIVAELVLAAPGLLTLRGQTPGTILPYLIMVAGTLWLYLRPSWVPVAVLILIELLSILSRAALVFLLSAPRTNLATALFSVFTLAMLIVGLIQSANTKKQTPA